ncbi:hypothetical protein I204_06716 [Kwoniella mangroviensis CBS 8886]|uniref:uncharacterized protein n=1 Tax=Kwoniella mangroviensis CBS 8507 TaxID=1296122 RepID=UPI00080CE166|nr:uncharacterized protein I203_01311 [Kwoniella mangroviensis CBS 8507]OCF69454.1 hypothetical protein I203_01311 [Kwoniella mangroviensis CBS 8507]OCF72337.1 hypothetical protein I204_06716 [Kwoniella mangroviensis CBS 8886]
MADCIPIAPELPFRQQVIELASHLARSLPNSDQASYREFVGSYESQVNKEGEEDVAAEQKTGIVKSLVAKVGELKGALDGLKESDVENSHLLLQYTLSTTFDPSTEEYSSSVKNVVEAVKKGGEASGKQSRVDVASRILNNTYNYLPSTSSLRPTVLLSLFSLLSTSSDISILPLSSEVLSKSISQWAISSKEKVDFLLSLSQLYLSASELNKALDVLIIALKESVDTKIVEKAILVNLAISDKFELDEILKIQGVKENLGNAKSVVDLFEGDEIENVKKGQEWANSNAAWVEGAGISGFTVESVVRKVRLVALLALAARSETRQLEYAPIAKALGIDESEVEAVVIDAVRSKLLSARISQPLSLIKTQSISTLSSSTQRFGSNEWKLLEKRLNEWKVSVTEARSVVEEAQKLAEQPLSGSGGDKRRGGGGGGKRDNRQREEQGQGQQDGQSTQQQGEEVAAA